LVISVCAEAAAQTATAAMVQSALRRDNRQPLGIKTTVINYADCAADEKITFKLNNLSSTLTLDVWAGWSSDCGSPTRNSAATVPGQCWQVFTATPWPTDSFTLAVRELLPHGATGPGSAPDTVCNDVASEGTGNGTITVHFIPLMTNTQTGASEAAYGMTYDLQGPAPPTGFSVGLGDSRLIPSWPAGSRADVSSYKLYCQPSDSCSSTYLVPGAIPGIDPPDDLKTSTAGQNATEGEVSGLVNDQNYVCAIAAVDPNGNVGKLSEIDCGAPKPVNGYFRSYRAAGGTAGGGFCSFGREVNSAAPPVVLAAVAALAARRRRRRSAV
jgi:hypothetical protein